MTEIIKGENYTVTSVSDEISDRRAKVIVVEGLYRYLEENRDSIADECTPDNYTRESCSLTASGDGLGKLTIRCVMYNDGGFSFSAEKSVVRIDMVETDYNLINHPAITKTARKIAAAWLATDATKRYDADADKYYYENSSGSLVEITSGHLAALRFCKAYMSGIETFRRYFPVIERISTWKNPPGLNPSGRSFDTGSPEFSSNIGSYNSPPISLSGYPNGYWFKSKDSWVQNADTTWQRTEQWTYTPEGATGENAWIYNTL